MKTYVLIDYSDSRMGAQSSYHFLKENQLKHYNTYGDFVKVYELANSRPLSEKKMKELGIPFMEFKSDGPQVVK
jgi:hypothetical protein